MIYFALALVLYFFTAYLVFILFAYRLDIDIECAASIGLFWPISIPFMVSTYLCTLFLDAATRQDSTLNKIHSFFVRYIGGKRSS